MSASKAPTSSGTGTRPNTPPRKSWMQTFSYGSGRPGDGLGDKYDPNKGFMYIDGDGMLVIGMVTLGPVERPEWADPTVPTDATDKANESEADKDENGQLYNPNDEIYLPNSDWTVKTDSKAHVINTIKRIFDGKEVRWDTFPTIRKK